MEYRLDIAKIKALADSATPGPFLAESRDAVPALCDALDLLIKNVMPVLNRQKAIIDDGPMCDCEPEGHVCGWPQLKREIESLELAVKRVT